MKPEQETYYDAEVYDFEDVVVLVLDSSLGIRDLQTLSLVNKFYESSSRDKQTVITGLEAFA